jgi:hypothetical protein
VNHDQEIVALKARLATLEAASKSSPQSRHVKPAAEEQGVRIYTPAARRIELPSETELKALLGLILAAYPKMGPDLSNVRWASQEETQYFSDFGYSFRALAHMPRAAAPDSKYYLSFWAGEASAWLRSQGSNVDLPSGGSFMAAALAHGDIPYTPPFNDEAPVLLGLARGDADPVSRWRDVLSSHQLLPPTQLTRPREVRSPVAIRFGT